MASRRSSPTRSACWRKSGVVSITTLWPPREISREGRSLLSCGSLDLHTRQGHPSVGTPMEVPEPRTVTFSGARGMLKSVEIDRRTEPGRRHFLRAALSLSFGGLGCNGLIDFQVGHLQLAEQVQEQSVFFGSEITFGLFVQTVQHVNEFASGLGINHGLTSARIGIRAKDHSCVATQHANEVFEGRQA